MVNLLHLLSLNGQVALVTCGMELLSGTIARNGRGSTLMPAQNQQQ